MGVSKMELSGLERDFLSRLVVEPWASPPLFDHSLVARLAEAGFVTAGCSPSGVVWYEITDAGVQALRESEA
jgi:hypothetical protein